MGMVLRLSLSMNTRANMNSFQQLIAVNSALYHPVRLALTGCESGPELAVLMVLLPAGYLTRRLRAVLEFFSPSRTEH